MLRKKAEERVGLPDVRRAEFYAGFDWDAFHARRMQPPFVPQRDPKLPQPR